jgi:hypothetical protein
MITRIAFILVVLSLTASAAPPFSGTIFVSPNIITTGDPTTYKKTISKGRGKRTMFDRRKNAFIKVNAFIFQARFRDSRAIEVDVNPEFRSEKKAKKLAIKYARAVGRLPKELRAGVRFLWIHNGVEPFGGGNNSLLIHIGQSAIYERDGILEETLFHEAAHTSLDPYHAASAGWIAAQGSDPDFISTYALDNPTREDVAESFLMWFAVRHRPDRIDATLTSTITNTIPARLSYFDGLGF